MLLGESTFTELNGLKSALLYFISVNIILLRNRRGAGAASGGWVMEVVAKALEEMGSEAVEK